MAKISKIYQISDEEFEEIINNSKSYNECLKKMGMTHGRSQNDIVKKRCKELNISTEHFTYSNSNFKQNRKYSLEEILV